jgi:hypothetical protein
MKMPLNFIDDPERVLLCIKLRHELEVAIGIENASESSASEQPSEMVSEDSFNGLVDLSIDLDMSLDSSDAVDMSHILSNDSD